MGSEDASASVEVDVVDDVMEIMLNQPERRNPIDYGTIEALTRALRTATEGSARCVLIHGAGKGFCSGGDLTEFQAETDAASSPDPYELHRSGQHLADLLALIPRLPVPVVVAAHGFAIAGGCGLVAAADIAVAAEGTRFGSSEVKIGLFPLMILPALRTAIGPRRTRELALTGRTITTEEALRIGLVHRVLPAQDFLTGAREVARQVAGLGRTTLGLGKRHLAAVEEMSPEAALAFGQAMRGTFMATDDFREGVAAFLAKRPPDFR